MLAIEEADFTSCRTTRESAPRARPELHDEYRGTADGLRSHPTGEPVGTLVVDTAPKHLYHVTAPGRAI